MDSRARWREIIEQEDDEEQDPSRLHVPCSLTLSHPSGFEVLQGACAVDGNALM